MLGAQKVIPPVNMGIPSCLGTLQGWVAKVHKLARIRIDRALWCMTAGATRLGSFVVFVVVLLTPAQTSLLERAAIVPERAADPAAGCIQSRKMKAVFLDIDGVLKPVTNFLI